MEKEIPSPVTSPVTPNRFILCGCDTDSIMFASPDGKEFTKTEQERLLKELNDLFPEYIRWDHDGYYPKVLYFKKKNYILYDGVKTTYKGSSLKSSTLEKRLKDFLHEVIQSILDERGDHVDIYHRYIKEAWKITTAEQMKDWSSKKSLTETTYKSERANETKVIDAVEGREYSVGDKCYVHFLEDGTLRLAEEFDGSYDRMVLVEKLYNCTKRFETVLATDVFIKYNLKKNKAALETLLTEAVS